MDVIGNYSYFGFDILLVKLAWRLRPATFG